MLSSNQRIKSQGDINSVLKSKLFYVTQYSTIKLASDTAPAFRCMVIVSKKIYKKSNKRNRIRRKIMALFEDLNSQKRLPPYTKCAIRITSKEILHLTKEELNGEILPYVNKLFIKLLKETQKSKK
jgi:ribonuclease P protein component